MLQKTFVDIGPVSSTLSSLDHQIIFGRRGTGKTHLLSVLRQARSASGEVVVQLDMRTIGSTGGIYSDPSLSLPQRATRLLVDVLAAIHGALLDQTGDDNALIHLGDSGNALNDFYGAHVSVKVQGTTTIESSRTQEESSSRDNSLGLKTNFSSAEVEAATKSGTSSKAVDGERHEVIGKEVYRVNFGNVGVAVRALVRTLPNKRLWLLIDEWSEIPLDIQPYLADLLRRALLPTRGVTMKIAAIEQRSRFMIPDRDVGNIGLELGADVATALNLDDHMVFENDEATAVGFFQNLVLKHVQAALEAEGMPAPKDVEQLISEGFTQANAFAEVVRACEGVPRDAINILSQAGQKANKSTISVNDVRFAARQWYQASKDGAVSASPQAKKLLTWIVDVVIKERQAKAFLLESSSKDDLIDYLYDERVLHLLRKGISAKDEAGKRFNVYGIDYGCYVDLINTAKAPKGLLDIGTTHAEFSANIPHTDLRAIRRCVLNLDDFYNQQKPSQKPQQDLFEI
ncbi:hypothetical protein ACCQ08_14100 [Comamonas sp. SY3]|uniref:hypothetical protein n=1 Tax=Comamonas sp. SY3 TaxID=3243601 RepID=UPI0035930507